MIAGGDGRTEKQVGECDSISIYSAIDQRGSQYGSGIVSPNQT